MPWTAASGTSYKLVFLDTNALSEVSKNFNNAGKGFLEIYPPNEYAPCFSVYNIIEVKKADNGKDDSAFSKFLDFFSIYPCFLIWPYKLIIQEEMDCYNSNNKTPMVLANSFTIMGTNDTYDLKKWLSAFWDKKSLVNTIENELKKHPSVAADWEKQRSLTNAQYMQENEELAVMSFLCSVNRTWFENNGLMLDYTKFPGARTMLYSQYSKVHKSRKPITTNDVMDVMISCAIPYMDAVVTEASQAEVFKQAKNHIPQVKHIKISSLRDLRKT